MVGAKGFRVLMNDAVTFTPRALAQRHTHYRRIVSSGFFLLRTALHDFRCISENIRLNRLDCLSSRSNVFYFVIGC